MAGIPINPVYSAILALIISTALVAYLLRKPSSRQIPGPRGYPIVGVLLDILHYTKNRKGHLFYDDLTERFGRIVKFKVPGMRIVLTSDPTLIHRMLSEPTNSARDAFLEVASGGIVDNALFTMGTHDKWKKHRKLVQPAFSPAQLRRAAEITHQKIKGLVQRWKTAAEHSHNGYIVRDVYLMMTSVTLDIIGQVAFSYDFEAVESCEDEKRSDKHEPLMDVMNILSRRLDVPPILWRFYKLSSDSPRIQKVQKYLPELFEAITSAKKEKTNNENHQNLLDLLLEANSANSEKFSNEEVFGETIGFLMAGHDTTANTISFALYEIARHPEVQKKLKSEINGSIGPSSENGSIESVEKFQYLDCVVKESQRLHSVVPVVARHTLNAVYHDGYVIPADTILFLSLRGVHRNPEVWSNPLEFVPERWIDRESILPNSFLPFGDGQHNCIGKKMAVIEIKIILLTILQHFSVEVVAGETADFCLSITYGLKSGLKLRLRADLED
ncbi:hypothetical protein HDU84_008958 [Entophlyctis sp. JEL0112]|nr:hypothetical protein HDU84_008958 [Entophlyctis sp. JEL0112]